MDEQTLRKIVKEVVDEAVDPIKKQLSSVEGRLDDPETGLQRINEKLDAVSGDVHDLKDQVRALDDKTGMYHARNKREVDEIKRHLNLPIIPDRPEL